MNDIGLELLVKIIDLLPERQFKYCVRALVFAVKAHQGQMDYGDEPHIYHVLEVTLAAAEYARAYPDKVFNSGWFIASGVLHDVVEDTDVTIGQIGNEFGMQVAYKVAALTHVDEDESDEEYLRRIAEAGWDALKLKSFDRIRNLRRLWLAPAEFRARKISEVRASLGLWRELDPECADEIKTVLEEVEKGEEHE